MKSTDDEIRELSKLKLTNINDTGDECDDDVIKLLSSRDDYTIFSEEMTATNFISRAIITNINAECTELEILTENQDSYMLIVLTLTIY